MKKDIMTMLTATATIFLAPGTADAQTDKFHYADEKFADIQMLRYKVEGFDDLSLKEKTFIYYLQEAALWGRDILFDQNGRYNLRIVRALEAIYTDYKGDRKGKFFTELSTYLKRVWFSSGIHHHYGSEKFVPGFTAEELREAIMALPAGRIQLVQGQTIEQWCDEIFPVIFDAKIMAKRVNQADGEDLVATSASNYYAPGISQKEAEEFYTLRKASQDPHPVMTGMNSKLVRNADGEITEQVWRSGGLYGETIDHIIENLVKARPYACSPAQQRTIDLLLCFYRTGDLRIFDELNIQWLRDTESTVDFVMCFTESYGDPLGMKASWESIVNFKDHAATERTEKISANAQWFEDHSPVDSRFKKEKVKGVSAKVINAAILSGDLYPSTAIGINLPNSDWVRREHGSKSVTIGNLMDAYSKAAQGSGMQEEFVQDKKTRELIAAYGDICDNLHTDLHECLGHGSGKLLPGVDPDTLRAYGSTIEEARADLFGLYYLADPKLVELGLLPNAEAYKSGYYAQMLNGLLTQMVRIKPGDNIEEAHMRNRALIAQWCYEKGKDGKVMELYKAKGKTYLRINDYEALRQLFGKLLAEIQRIKSEGDFEGARQLVENYGVKIDPTLHKEVLARYGKLQIKPYKGFINPVYKAVRDAQGNITDVVIDYTEPYDTQMLRYSHDYRTLPDQPSAPF